MTLLLGLAAGLLGFLLSFKPIGNDEAAPPRRLGLFALAAAVYLAIAALFFVPLATSAPERVLEAYVSAVVATLAGVSGAVAGRRKGAEWWLLLAWPVPFIVATAVRLAG